MIEMVDGSNLTEGDLGLCFLVFVFVLADVDAVAGGSGYGLFSWLCPPPTIPEKNWLSQDAGRVAIEEIWHTTWG